MLGEGETELASEGGVRLYSGDDRTEFEDGTLTLTSHRLVWIETNPPRRALQLPLHLVARVSKARTKKKERKKEKRN